MDGDLNILIADDEEVVHKTIGHYLTALGHNVNHATDGEKALRSIEKEDFDLALLDVRMPKLDGLALLSKASSVRPEMSCVIITGHADMSVAIQALKGGAVDFLIKPIKLIELDAILEKGMRVRQLRQERRLLRDTIGGIQSTENFRHRFQQFIGVSPASQRIIEQIHKIVEAECDTILITGETGTGKEVVARQIHREAEGRESPFIAVSCPALPDTLVESELFGHVKGAFTGAAADRAGYFELANSGTLFLDEVGDLSLAAQSVLLRVIETRKFRRVGGTREIGVNLRIVAATNVELEQAVLENRFRRDLFYRLNLFPVVLPPLRERHEDIIPLAEYFLSTYTENRGFENPGFTPEAREILSRYDYPGNARELRNIVERAAILCRGKAAIEPEHLTFHLNVEKAHRLNVEKAYHLNVEKARPQTGKGPAFTDERDLILKALEECRWNRRKAAEKLHMPYSTLRFKLDRLKINPD